MKPRLLALAVLLVFAGGWQAVRGAAGAPEQSPQRGNAGGRGGQRSSAAVLDVRVPDHAADVLLARPSPTSITLSLIVYRESRVFVAYGPRDGALSGRTEPVSLAAWANGMRKRHFPNPVPDGFYTGNTSRELHAGLLEDYCAWRWGDALFVVLDPFWYSERRSGDDGWAWTLGQEQYQWLARTLAQSDARFTFVFIHHLVGGGQQARGGAEASRFFEWGGADADGTPGFASHRRGWESPIHDLLVKHRVTAVFHGHDHFYAHQERDGIAYREVPQPGDARGGSARAAGAYGHTAGTVLGGTGYLRVKVGADSATIEYVDLQSAGSPGRVADRYILRPADHAGRARPTPRS